MYSVILCGGSGTRLWPLSRKNYPKQFLSFSGDQSLLQETFLRMRDIMPKENIFFSTNKANYFNVFNQIKDLEPDFNKDQIITEPEGKNTAPAMALSVKYITEKFQANPEEPIIFLPSDHYIKDKEVFIDFVKKSLAEVGDNIGTIGIIPSKAHTGYGYIQKGEKIGSCFRVSEFKEKPDKETAEKYIESGQYAWNSGIYFFNAKTFFQELKEHAPEIFNVTKDSLETLLDEFHNLPSISIDYAISEKSKKVVVFEGDFGWNDIGSFDSLAELGLKGKGRQLSIDSKNIYVHSETDRFVASIGVEDLIVIDSRDSTLIYKRGRGEDVKKIVKYLEANNLKEIEHNLVDHRPWGHYEILLTAPNYQSKIITVYPGEKLSTQRHLHRSEHWVVVRGIARVLNDGQEIFLNENESTFVKAGSEHYIENPGKINLELIEIQTGDYLGEDDIIRSEDRYGRTEK